MSLEIHGLVCAACNQALSASDPLAACDACRCIFHATCTDTKSKTCPKCHAMGQIVFDLKESDILRRLTEDTKQAKFSNIRRRLLSGSSEYELLRLKYELEAHLEAHPFDLEARLLMYQVTKAIKPVETKRPGSAEATESLVPIIVAILIIILFICFQLFLGPQVNNGLSHFLTTTPPK